MGNRIAKHIYADNAFTQWENSTYYVRDASGNVMATYNREATGQTPPSSFRVAERHMYGSSRLGIDATPYEFIATNYTTSPEAARSLGQKHYEISNHLGNVLSYTAVVLSATDYSPFGVGLYGRSWSEGYWYGFNGMEKDDEMKTNGNSYTTEYRQFEPRIGRWLSVDPMRMKFPARSPYHFAYNSPLSTIDHNGAENVVVVGNQPKGDGADDGPSSDFKKNDKENGYTYGENTRHFVQNGLDEARRMKKDNPSEETTMIVYKGTYSDDELSKYQNAAEKDGIKFLIYQDDADVADYINKKASWTWFGNTSARDKDKITDFTFVGHGGPDKMLAGYNHDKSA